MLTFLAAVAVLSSVAVAVPNYSGSWDITGTCDNVLPSTILLITQCGTSVIAGPVDLRQTLVSLCPCACCLFREPIQSIRLHWFASNSGKQECFMHIL